MGARRGVRYGTDCTVSKMLQNLYQHGPVLTVASCLVTSWSQGTLKGTQGFSVVHGFVLESGKQIIALEDFSMVRWNDWLVKT